MNFGSGITITKMIEFLEAASDKSTSFIPLAKHLSKVKLGRLFFHFYSLKSYFNIAVTF